MLLLDSNAFYWLLTEPERFGQNAKTRIQKASKVYVSSITVLELTIKQLKAKLPEMDFAQAIALSGLESLPFVDSAAQAISEFPGLIGHDPFDRALLGQALVHRLEFMTSDRTLLGLSQSWIINIGE